MSSPPRHARTPQKPERRRAAVPRSLHVLPTQLRARCDPASLSFETTAELTEVAASEVVYQDRALEAVEFGLGIDTRGYNLFVLGETGSGKTSMLKRMLTRRALREPTPADICYVHDFDEPETPVALLLPAGQGRRFARGMEDTISTLRREIARTLAGTMAAEGRSTISLDARKKEERLFRRLSREAGKHGLALRREEDRLMVLPIVDGQPVEAEAYGELPEALRAQIEERAASMHERFAAFDRARLRIVRKAQERMTSSERRAVRPVVDGLLAEVRQQFAPLGGEHIGRWLDQVAEAIVDGYRDFLPPDEWGPPRDKERKGEEEPDPSPDADELLAAYRVNVLVDRRRLKGAPVVSEPNPTYANLMGYLEYRDVRGTLRADHTMIRAGALHKANGGYLLLQVQDLAHHPAAWDALKRTLRLKEIRTEDLGEETRPKTSGTIHPAPIALDTKVVLIGTPEHYYQLKTQDEEFGRLFKVKAEFAYSVPRTARNIMRLARFIARVTHEEGYLPLHREAVALLVEDASREVEDQREMTTRINVVLDLVAEANYWACRCRRKLITAGDVERALAERRRRHALEEDQVLRQLQRGSILVETRGAVVGQINGLAVYDLGDYAFGVPQRITAQVFCGKKGVLSIEREVQLSGAIHDKGALTLAGYLGGRYARETPLAFTASITFEQMYGGVEGDSASATELFALLSALSDVPIRQQIAVTGSVNQLGEIQPVGGINEKVEGMYRLCAMRGLSGTQGAIIPRRNVRNLMLAPEVAEAIRVGRFHLWAVDTVDQAMEILTGMPAGRPRPDGSFPAGTLNQRVTARLRQLATTLEGHSALA